MGQMTNPRSSESIRRDPSTGGWSRSETRSAAKTLGSPAQSPHLCGCGCGAPVSRRFLPGHDAKLKSRLLRDLRLGDATAAEQLRQLGWLPPGL